MRHITAKICFFVMLFSMSTYSLAYVEESERALHKIHFQYQMFCQGCHVSDGRGGKDVPDMRNHIGAFLTIPQGRDYLIQVPGSANAAINDADLANLMNWIVVKFGGESTPDNFKPYTSEEVGRLRQSPLTEVTEYRKWLVQQIALNKETKIEESQ